MIVAKVSSLLMQIEDAPTIISAILTEVGHIKNVFTAFPKSLDRTVKVSGARAALIQIGDLVVILIQTVLCFL